MDYACNERADFGFEMKVRFSICRGCIELGEFGIDKVLVLMHTFSWKAFGVHGGGIVGGFIGYGGFNGSRIHFLCGGRGCCSVVTVIVLSYEVVKLSTWEGHDSCCCTIEALGMGQEDKGSMVVTVVCRWVCR